MSNDGKAFLVSYVSFNSVDQCSVVRMKVFVHSIVVWFAFVLFFATYSVHIFITVQWSLVTLKKKLHGCAWPAKRVSFFLFTKKCPPKTQCRARVLRLPLGALQRHWVTLKGGRLRYNGRDLPMIGCLYNIDVNSCNIGTGTLNADGGQFKILPRRRVKVKDIENGAPECGHLLKLPFQPTN